MAISFKCAGCGKQYSVGDKLAGKKAQCKNCGVVMKIPAMAPSHEPDLCLEGGDGHGGAGETVAGSLVPGQLDTVAGRSVSGQSMSGRSAAGKSASGRSAAGRSAVGPPAYTPPPVDDAPSELEALQQMAPSQLQPLKHVAQSEHEAFDVGGGTDQPIYRGPARPNRAPPEIVSFLLIAVLIAALGYSAFNKLQVATNSLPADVAAEAGKPMTLVIVQNAAVFLLTALVAAPLVLAGWIGACKITNFRTPDGIYVRSFGLASLPVATFVLAYTFGLGASAPVLALATALLGYVVLQFVHDQKPVLAGAATGLGTLGGVVGVAVAVMVADNVSQGMAKDYQAKVAAAAAKVQQRKDIARNTAKSNGAWTSTKTNNTAEAETAVKTVRDRLDALKAKLTAPQQTREAVDAEAASLAAALAEGKKAFAERPEWDAMTGELQSAQSTIASLPTGKPPADLAEAPPAGTEWGVRAGRREASAFTYNFTPPADAMLDLESALASSGAPVAWSIPSSQAKIKFELIKAVSDQQKRPWVAPAYLIAAAKDAPVSVPVDGTPKVEYGTINGVPATKIVAPEGETGKVVTVYTLHNGDSWLRATIGPAAPNDAGIEPAEQAVRSLRLRSPGEPAVDPLPAADLVARFEADPTSADKIAALLHGKPGAEEAVLKGIGFAPDDATLKKYGPLLASAATSEKGARFLWKIADGDDATAKAARETLRRIQPKAADDVAFALLDVKAGSKDRVRSGLTTLEAAEVDKDHQTTVTRTLVNAFEPLANGGYGKLLESVLGKWLDDDLGRRVQTVLENPNAGESERRMAMRVLAQTGKPKYVPAICKWLVADSAAVDTLVQMGPMVEKDVINVLTDRENSNPKVRLTAIGVLSEVGTPRSITTLQKMTGVGDADVREAAKAAIGRIKERNAQPK